MIDLPARNLPPLLLCLLLGATGCRSTPDEGPEAAVSDGPAPELEPPLEAIARWQEARTDGGGRLQRLAAEGDEEVRQRAVVALGRLPRTWYGEGVTLALAGALEDRSPRVRASAAFALGLRGDPAALEALRATFDDDEPEVRARAIEAASKLAPPGAEAREAILYALFSDPSFRVRGECAVAPHRWTVADEGASAADEALARCALRLPARLRPDGENGDSEVPEVSSRALFSLSRRAVARADAGQADQTAASVREAFLAWYAARDFEEARIFAVIGLGALSPDALTRAALAAALADPDWRVAVEAARGLARHPDLEALPSLERALAHPSTHVRQQVALCLGAYGEAREHARSLLERAVADRSPNVRAAAVEALARLLGDGYAAELARRAVESDARMRAGVARGTRHLEDPLAVPILVRMTHDEDLSVAYAATEALGLHLTAAARERLHEVLLERDIGLRLAAVLALGQAPTPEDLPPLETAWTTSRGDIAFELQAAILEVAARIGSDRAIALCARGLESSRGYVRQEAHEKLAQLMPEGQVPPPGPPPPRSQPLSVPGPSPAQDNPTVELRTTRGTLVVELYADVAPVHVYNFLELAREKHYEGLVFHRVVPDFVVQGGDYRGDGNGGVSWRGEPLRHELGPRKFVRGALGMPRNDDLDSGGSQIFVTHRATPHLDGRYTLFGQVRQGLDVLDQIEAGDSILGVRVRGIGAP